MKILFVAHGFPPDESAGTELYAEAAAEALAQLGHDVHVFAANPSAQAPVHRVDRLGAVTVERYFHPRPFGDESHLAIHDDGAEAAFATAVRRIRPDVVHVVSLIFVSHRVIELARAEHVPVVVSPTDFWFLCPRVHLHVGARHPFRGRLWGLNCFAHTEARSLRWLASLLRRRLLVDRMRRHISRAEALRAALARASIILAPSEFVRARFVEFGVDPTLIETLPLGIEIRPVGRLPRGDTIRVGFVGAFVPDKGPDLLIRAFQEVDAPRARLIIRGRHVDKEYAASLQALAGGNPRIEVGGPFDLDEVPSFLAGIDLLVVPTRVHESFSRIAREAFAARVPVLAAEAGALPEIVVPGANGALFEAGNTASLAEKLRELLRPGALASLDEFPGVKAIDEHAHELVDRYERLLDATAVSAARADA